MPGQILKMSTEGTDVIFRTISLILSIMKYPYLLPYPKTYVSGSKGVFPSADVNWNEVGPKNRSGLKASAFRYRLSSRVICLWWFSGSKWRWNTSLYTYHEFVVTTVS